MNLPGINEVPPEKMEDSVPETTAGEPAPASKYQPPPVGWHDFGTHAGVPGAHLEFSTQVGDDGMPLWERAYS